MMIGIVCPTVIKCSVDSRKKQIRELSSQLGRVYTKCQKNIFQNSNVSLFGRIDDHKQTGRNNTYKVNFEQGFKKLNLNLYTILNKHYG